MSPFGITTIRPIPHSLEHLVALQKQARVCGGATDFLRLTLTLPPSHVKKKLRRAISRICLLTESNPSFAFSHSDLSVRFFKACFHRTTVETVRQHKRAEITFSPLSTRLPRALCVAVRRTPVCPHSTLLLLLLLL
jgi:hypothetical protein